MRLMILIATLLFATPTLAGDVDGLVRKQSPYGVHETMNRLEQILTDKGITVALRWDHAKRARDVDIELRDTEVMIFGNPKIGSHLMTAAQSAGIDLPMKALAWKDADGQVWLGYNAPAYIARRHGIEGRDKVIDKMSGALDKLTGAAVQED